MNTRSAVFFSLLVIFFSASLPAHAAGEDMAGIFSNFKLDKKSGSLSGVELFIFPYRIGYMALVQIAADDRYNVLLPLKNDHNEIEFVLPAESPYGAAHFVGRISHSELTGHFFGGRVPAGADAEQTLDRGKSYWQ